MLEFNEVNRIAEQYFKEVQGSRDIKKFTVCQLTVNLAIKIVGPTDWYKYAQPRLSAARTTFLSFFRQGAAQRSSLDTATAKAILFRPCKSVRLSFKWHTDEMSHA